MRQIIQKAAFYNFQDNVKSFVMVHVALVKTAVLLAWAYQISLTKTYLNKDSKFQKSTDSEKCVLTRKLKERPRPFQIVT